MKVISLLMILNNRIRKRNLLVVSTVRRTRMGWKAFADAYVCVEDLRKSGQSGWDEGFKRKQIFNQF